MCILSLRHTLSVLTMNNKVTNISKIHNIPAGGYIWSSKVHADWPAFITEGVGCVACDAHCLERPPVVFCGVTW